MDGEKVAVHRGWKRCAKVRKYRPSPYCNKVFSPKNAIIILANMHSASAIYRPPAPPPDPFVEEAQNWVELECMPRKMVESERASESVHFLAMSRLASLWAIRELIVWQIFSSYFRFDSAPGRMHYMHGLSWLCECFECATNNCRFHHVWISLNRTCTSGHFFFFM